MTARSRFFRAAALTGAALTLAAGAAAVAPATAFAAAAGSAPSLPPTADGHAYRHGVVPPNPNGATPASRTPSTLLGKAVRGSYGRGPLYYGNGPIVSGAPKVYLDLWGSQWQQGGDPDGMATYLQDFFSGLGTGGDAATSAATWSGIMSRYCEGAGLNATTCASTLTHVGYPADSGVLAGVWFDSRAAAPSNATQAQLQQEAVDAAKYFGFTSWDGSSQFFIVSPTGTHPDGFNTSSGNFCAWHDNTGDTSLGSSESLNVPFTNMPYVPDMGTSCGQNFVNAGSAGTLDGVSIVGGHEYGETLTDPMPSSGWVDSQGYEIGDKCAWISPSQGGSGDLTLADGQFAVQSMWSNIDNGCDMGEAPFISTSSGSLSFSGATSGGAWTPISGLTVTATGSTPSVTVASSSPDGYFSTAASGPFSRTLTVVSGSSFYYEDTDPSTTPTLTATATGYSSASESFTVGTGVPTTLSIAPTSASLSSGQTQVFTATGTDGSGNSFPDPNTMWTSTSGTLSTSGPSASVTLTAGSTNSTVGASDGSVSAPPATVTVSANSTAMTVTVTTGQTTRRGNTYKTPLTVTATDQSGNALAGDPVTWNIYSGGCSAAGSAVASTSGTTDSSGQNQVTFTTHSAATYCAVATVSATGYSTTSNSASFTT